MKTYTTQAMRTAKRFSSPQADLEHAALGLITEIGELATEVKRHVIYLKPLDREHIHEEIGDVLWYWALGAEVLWSGLDITFAGLNASVLQAVQKPVPLDTMLSRCIRRMASGAGDFGVHIEVGKYEEARDVLADLLAVMCAVCIVLGFDFAQVAQANIDKLKARFPDRFTEEAAEARADKGGADARVS